MTRVAVTGIAGHLGGKLLQRLDQEKDVERIVGVDIREPKYTSSKLKFYRHDVGDPFGTVFAENEIDCAIHLAFAIIPGHDAEKSRRINVGGTENFLEACKQESVKWLLFLSSCTAYGGHPDNPVPLYEDSPLRPNKEWLYSWHKAQCEQRLGDFAGSNPGKGVTVARCCPILGSKGVATGVKNMMFPLVMVRAMGHDALWQFIHDDDWAEIMLALMRKRLTGTFNVAGDEPMSFSEITHAMGRLCLPLPGWLLDWGITASWKLHLQSRSMPGGQHFLKYPVVLNTEKVQKATGYKFQYTTRQALDAYLSK